ncbi:MAG: peptidoglycan-binding protein [Ignavibacteria bacterium]|nr:peptidoglycan-binding protein [Ignavibacteria bacterium]
MRYWTTSMAGCVAAAFLVAGCGQTQETQTDELDAMRVQIEDQQQQISNLEMTLSEKERSLEQIQREMSEPKTPAEPEAVAEAPLLPPDAKPGECYARVFIPPTYETVEEELLEKQASERVEIVPATYEWVEETVLVKQASSEIEQVPAKFEWVEEEVMVKPAHTEWKKGRGLIERVDNTTGEIMCLVEVPATYKTVRTQVVSSPATTKEVVIPAEYQTIKVKKEVTPARVNRVNIPAEYSTISKTVMVSEGRLEWQRVLCETNMTRDMVKQLQIALRDAGHNPGPIDGVVGSLTLAATKSYQTEKGLATGGLTYETIRSLGVRL